jgi:hypothetical protein
LQQVTSFLTEGSGFLKGTTEILQDNKEATQQLCEFVREAREYLQDKVHADAEKKKAKEIRRVKKDELLDLQLAHMKKLASSTHPIVYSLAPTHFQLKKKDGEAPEDKGKKD